MSVAHQQIFIPTAEQAWESQLHEELMKREAALDAAINATTSSSPAQLKRKRASYLRDTAPRPPNAFMLFRKDFMDDLVMDRTAFYDELARIDPDDKAKKSSFWAKTAGALWKQATRDLRERYTSKAAHAKKEHAKKYPDYQFAPKRRKGLGKASALSQSVRAFPYERSVERESSCEEEVETVEQPAEDLPLYLSVGNEEASYQAPQLPVSHPHYRSSLSFSNPPPPPDFSLLSPTTQYFNSLLQDSNIISTAPLTPMEFKFPQPSPSGLSFDFGSFDPHRPSTAFDTSFNFGVQPNLFSSTSEEVYPDALLTEYFNMDHGNSPGPSLDSMSSGSSFSSSPSPPAGSPSYEPYPSPSSSF